MVDEVSGHPAADRSTPEALVVEQDRRVVPLSTWVADAAVAAAGTGRVLQVLTPPGSRITYPLELLLRDGGGQWVVREGPERFSDGLTGFRLRWRGGRFATDLDADPPRPPEQEPGAGDLEVQVATLHPASDALELGGSAAAVVRALSGSDPWGWGVAEPASQPWSPRELTSFARGRAPEPTQLVLVGDGVVGQLVVSRVAGGVHERVRLSGPAAGAVDTGAVESLAAELAGSARSMVVAAHPGRSDGRLPGPTLPALPFGLLVGHGVVAERGVPHAAAAPAAGVSVLGPDERRAAWCRLDGGPGRPYEALVSVLTHFGLADPLDGSPDRG